MFGAKKIHILGISGTFMAGLALIAKQSGITVSGHDNDCYPPMKDQLAANDINVKLGYADSDLPPADLYIVGNSIKRGNPLFESILLLGLPYCSGPEWLYHNVLRHKWVIAISGTHGKTTTSSMLTWILESLGYHPSFLIGGIPENMGCSARLTASNVFVIEADEYDTALFDKRPKFIHYRPKTLVINNLDFDHADIYSSLAEISKQFCNLIKTVPSDGSVIALDSDSAVAEVLKKGCWSKQQSLSTDKDSSNWFYSGNEDFSTVMIGYAKRDLATFNLKVFGEHNAKNACMALVAANHFGVPISNAASALNSFLGVKRRLELKGTYAGVRCYDDFGHHPTAIESVLKSLKVGLAPENKIFAIVELGSYTLRSGLMVSQLQKALSYSSMAYLLLASGVDSSYDWTKWADQHESVEIGFGMEDISKNICYTVRPGDIVISFSSRNIVKIHELLRDKLLPAIC
ncbi:MAG: UDP-N-acetylmuramate:L-alanyl-gamma-D-glutamyl-meso-diaminopimelate ligase [Pseudomonadota bacterium]|nr:UDP-N-acetylmuramate:L-alanyl-gamma-D-glutamyl-meso-diaminopimelate ligase [Pseudomonadota bacterium]